MGRLAAHPWRWAGIGVAVHLAVPTVGTVLWDGVPGRDPLLELTAIAAGMLLGAALLGTTAIVGAADRSRRSERVPFALAALAAGLQIFAVIWDWINEFRGIEHTGYAAPWLISLLLLLIAFGFGFSARRFARRPEAVREPLPRRLRRGWREATKSWSVLAGSGSLLVLPALSFLLGMATWIAAFAVAAQFVEPTMSRLVLASFILLLPGTLLGTFFGVAFVAALDRRLAGERATVGYGLRVAWCRRGAIVGWSLLAAGVGAILQGLQQLRSEWAVAPLLSWLAGAAWGVLTLFVIPVLALEEVGVRDTVRRVGELVRRRWGEGMGGAGNFMLVGAVAGAVVGAVGSVIIVAIAVVVPDRHVVVFVYLGCFFMLLLLIAAIGAAAQVLSLALYRIATTGEAVGPFTADELEHAMVPRRRLRLRRRR
jgi:Family of unknown function (DUF6159)